MITTMKSQPSASRTHGNQAPLLLAFEGCRTLIFAVYFLFSPEVLVSNLIVSFKKKKKKRNHFKLTENL